MSKKKKTTRWKPNNEVEVVNVSTKENNSFILNDEIVFLDEKTDTYQTIPFKSSSYESYGDEKET
jgi:translation elongation factor P/translation initiation factor 5A